MRSIICACLFSLVTIILSANEDVKLNEVKIAIINAVDGMYTLSMLPE